MVDRPPRTDYFREVEAWERKTPSIADSVATSLSILVSVADSKGVLASSMASSVSINTSGANSRAVQASSMASSVSINVSTAWTMAASASTRASSVSVNLSTAASSLSLVTSTAQAAGSQASSMGSSVSLNLSTAGSSLSLITSTADSKGIQASSMALSVATELNIIRFAAHKNATNQTGIVTATPTKVTFPTEVYDIINNYDTLAAQWVPGIVGKAHVSAMITWTAAADQTEITILVYKNGASYKQETRKTSGTGEHCNHIDCDVLVDAVGDYFEIYSYQASGADKIISGDITKTWFMGHMLPN